MMAMRLGKPSAQFAGAQCRNRMGMRELGEASMARVEITYFDDAPPGGEGADALFDLGMKYATGNSVPTDFVAAHMWFNIAAMRGNRDAVRLRREIAEQMSDAEIAAAQRAARDWLAASSTKQAAPAPTAAYSREMAA
jgi:TPR repeat protein